jgi:protein-disulfide isomerase
MSTSKTDRETRNPRSAATAVAKLTRPVSEQYDHIRGPVNAPVQLVEYGDYECPHCGQAYYIVKELERLLANRLCFVFRNFPLISIHPHAEHAAEAAEASGAQGKFWGMHDSASLNIKTPWTTSTSPGMPPCSVSMCLGLAVS